MLPLSRRASLSRAVRGRGGKAAPVFLLSFERLAPHLPRPACTVAGSLRRTPQNINPPGKAPDGERKLYLLIEGPTSDVVRAAKNHIKKVRG